MKSGTETAASAIENLQTSKISHQCCYPSLFTSTLNVFSFHLSPSTQLLVYLTTFSLAIVSKEHRKHLDIFQTALNLAPGLQPRNQQCQHSLGTAWRKVWPEPHSVPFLHPQEKVSYAESFGGWLHARNPMCREHEKQAITKTWCHCQVSALVLCLPLFVAFH